MKKSKRYIVFFIPQVKDINGGILSIFSICKTSREFYDLHKAEVILCVYPGHESYGKNDLFNNDEIIYAFDDVASLSDIEYLQLHIPEYASAEVFTKLQMYNKFLASVEDLRINLLDQNVLLMPKPVDAADWFSLTPRMSQTTAHDKYSTQELADSYAMPVHHLSTFVDPTQYERRTYNEKENIIVLSPDNTELKRKVVQKLEMSLKDFELITVQNMRYEDYKRLMSRAKFVITFGEGFDGYYVEAFFTGGIAFAVYNDDFFPNERFNKFGNTYKSYEQMVDNIVEDIQYSDEQTRYEGIVEKNFNEITKLYSFESYKDKLRNFYQENFSYVPTKYSIERLLGNMANERRASLMELSDMKAQTIHLKTIVEEQAVAIDESKKNINNQADELKRITESLSWKVTMPLRAANKIFTRRR